MEAPAEIRGQKLLISTVPCAPCLYVYTKSSPKFLKIESAFKKLMTEAVKASSFSLNASY